MAFSVRHVALFLIIADMPVGTAGARECRCSNWSPGEGRAPVKGASLGPHGRARRTEGRKDGRTAAAVLRPDRRAPGSGLRAPGSGTLALRSAAAAASLSPPQPRFPPSSSSGKSRHPERPGGARPGPVAEPASSSHPGSAFEVGLAEVMTSTERWDRRSQPCPQLEGERSPQRE